MQICTTLAARLPLPASEPPAARVPHALLQPRHQTSSRYPLPWCQFLRIVVHHIDLSRPKWSEGGKHQVQHMQGLWGWAPHCGAQLESRGPCQMPEHMAANLDVRAIHIWRIAFGGFKSLKISNSDSTDAGNFAMPDRCYWNTTLTVFQSRHYFLFLSNSFSSFKLPGIRTSKRSLTITPITAVTPLGKPPQKSPSCRDTGWRNDMIMKWMKWQHLSCTIILIIVPTLHAACTDCSGSGQIWDI